jgi:hypothetical protein
MAIIKTATNLTVDVIANYNLNVGGVLEKISANHNMEATDGNLSLISNKKIVSQGYKDDFEATEDISRNKGFDYGPTVAVRLFIFQRMNGANNAGHVGMAIEASIVENNVVKSLTYHLGGVENWKPFGPNIYIAPGEDNDGWYQTTNNFNSMIRIMKENKKKGYDYNYDHYKFTTSHIVFNDISLLKGAISKMQNFKNRGYFVSGNNCMDACHEVLTMFTGDVPWPSTNYRPNGWYDSFDGIWSSSRSTR